jgi:Flp pilus assembly protein TadD
MDTPSLKKSEVSRSSYSADEVADIYRLAKLWLETGQHKRAETLLHGLNEVAPDFAPAWLGTAFLRAQRGEYETALHATNSALKAQSDMPEAMLYLVAIALTTGDISTAGTYLGEVREAIEGGTISNQHVVRFYKMQLARYQARG